ncbi:uncharacterized protein LOC124500586 [Dermatophagoides farinae]|uniref:uncharacterized protein LOC124500586 n=1 Tax=Dermatophagoides farinae TaxID=6954 RepID=UPI003F5F272D
MMDNNNGGHHHHDNKINSIVTATATTTAATATTTTTKGGPKIMKMLSENKLKRLNILTFINEKKDILFTKKKYKIEKEHIWREIFIMMRDSGMVSAEKDWRYVRDVSFSNWRKRAHKRLKYLASNGYRLNMDECEFLISDILGQTPDKSMIKKIQNGFKQQQMKTTIKHENNNEIDDDEDEVDEEEEEEMIESDDEYMIDSDEEDSQFIMDEMLLIPKIVINDHPNNKSNSMTNNESSNMKNNVKNQPHVIHHRNNNNNGTTTMVNGNGKPSSSSSKPIIQNVINNDHQYEYQSEQRLLELEIENKILKNRYMKLKILELEKNLGFSHCEQVKELLISSNHHDQR